MRENIRIIILLFAVLRFSINLSVDPNDLLNGQGLFVNQSLGNFVTDNQHVTSFLTVNSSNVLKLEKPSTSQVSFNQGLYYSFSNENPTHISFQFSSISPDTEDANLRLIDSETSKTVLLFRAGKAGFVRVNQNQMIAFYNYSVTESDSNVKTMKVDILINWAATKISIFIDGVFKGNANFFQQATHVNKIMLYNLYQSTSYWKNLVVCKDICYQFNHQKQFGFASAILTVIFMIFFS